MRRLLVASGLGVALLLGGVVVLGFLVLSLGGVRTYVIPSSAMEPTLHCARPDAGCGADHRDRVLGIRWWVSYGRGDIVVFETPPAAVRACGVRGVYIKRIVGLPGERVQIRLVGGRDEVFVNGKPLDEPYVARGRQANDPTRTFAVPKDGYFLLGDNRASSCDSRSFGSVPRTSLEAKIVLVYWPLGRLGIR